MSKKEEIRFGLFIFILFGTLIYVMSQFAFIPAGYYSYEENPVEYVENLDDEWFEVTVTKYNPTAEQCDSDPLITADGSNIDLEKLSKGELKWIAVSRELREYFSYGDTVILSHEDTTICGEYIVHDTMNPRWSRRIDLLSPFGDTLGKWEGCIIYKK